MRSFFHSWEKYIPDTRSSRPTSNCHPSLEKRIAPNLQRVSFCRIELTGLAKWFPGERRVCTGLMCHCPATRLLAWGKQIDRLASSKCARPTAHIPGSNKQRGDDGHSSERCFHGILSTVDEVATYLAWQIVHVYSLSRSLGN